jgi:hypothetical protein
MALCQAAGLRNISPDSARPLLLWSNFLQPDELEFLRCLVYESDPSEAFGTQFVRDGEPPPSAAAEDASPLADTESTDSSADDGEEEEEEGEGLDDATMALVAAAMARQKLGGDGQGAGAVTKNRLRTSHFLRTVRASIQLMLHPVLYMYTARMSALHRLAV